MAEEKQYQASDKKKDKARKDGKVKKSQLLTQSSLVCISVVLIFSLKNFLQLKTKELLNLCWIPKEDSLEICLKQSVNYFSFFIGLLLLLFFVTAILIEFLQVGFKIEFNIVKFKAKNLNLFSNLPNTLKKLKDSYIILIKLILYLFFFLAILYSSKQLIINSFTMDKEQILELTYSINYKVLSLLLFSFIGVGVIDYFFKAKKYKAELSMSEQEVRDEYKNLEGDPFVKHQRQALHEQLLNEEIKERVKGSCVILVEKN